MVFKQIYLKAKRGEGETVMRAVGEKRRRGREREQGREEEGDMEI